MKWWCRVSMRITATNTEKTYEILEIMLPELVQLIADRLGVDVKEVLMDNIVVIPYIEEVRKGE